VNWLRAALRRLDPWAALLLGGLLAMGVVILLATPGPWQRVVGKEPPVRLEAPAPDDVAIFVMGGRGGSCSGVIWLHMDAARQALTAVVVAPATSGFSPTDGFAPVSAIADSAGPSAAAEALGGALGVSMDAWVALDRKATELAVQAMVPLTDVKAARTRYRAARAAWRGAGGDERAWATQYETLSVALPGVQFQDLGVVAFSNYVLGFGFVRSDLTLQGAASLGEALRDVDPNKVLVRAAPVIVERSRGGEVWRADMSKVEPLRESLVIGIRPPDTERLVTVRERAARVLVVAPLARGAAERYAAEVSRDLARSAGAPVQVSLVSGADTRLAFRTARELDRRPALAVLVGPATAAAVPAVRKVYLLLRARRQEAVAAGPLQVAAGDAGDSATPQGAAVAGRLPVSWLPKDGAGASGLRTAAGDNVQTLVRVCWPGTLAPSLSSTQLGFTFVEARHTAVGVIGGTDQAAASALGRLRLWGFPAGRLTLEDGGWQPPQPGPLVCYRAGSKTAGLALAGDIGLPPGSVVKSGDSPRKLVLVLPD
jgi:hypothetical protein